MHGNPKLRWGDHLRSEHASASTPNTRLRLRCCIASERTAETSAVETLAYRVMRPKRNCCTVQLDSRVFYLSTLLLMRTRRGAVWDQSYVAETIPARPTQHASGAHSCAGFGHQHRTACAGGRTSCAGRRPKCHTTGARISRNAGRRSE